jgi:hypothetical protein
VPGTPEETVLWQRRKLQEMVRSLRLEGAFYRRWERLADAVRTGQRPEEDRGDE